MNYLHDKLTNGLIRLFIGVSNVAGGLAFLAPNIAAWIMALTMLFGPLWIGYYLWTHLQWVNG